jgi:hypothetical protein
MSVVAKHVYEAGCLSAYFCQVSVGDVCCTLLPQVTRAMFGAVAQGQAASSVLCAANNVQLMLVDVGVDADVQQQEAPSTSAGVHSIVVMHCKVGLYSSRAWHARPVGFCLVLLPMLAINSYGVSTTVHVPY